MKVKAIVSLFIVIGLAVVFFAWYRHSAMSNAMQDLDAAGKNSAASLEKIPTSSSSSGAVKAKGKRLRIRRQRSVPTEERTDLSPQDKDSLLSIEEALDNEDLNALRRVLPIAAASTNSEIRSELVDALGWFGERAMLDLLPFMADADEDIAQSALTHWTSALVEVDADEKCPLIEKSMMLIHDKVDLEMIVSELSDCDDIAALQTLVNVIESDNLEASEVAREHYEFTTGEEYTDLDAAEKWLLENYKSDDDDDE